MSFTVTLLITVCTKSGQKKMYYQKPGRKFEKPGKTFQKTYGHFVYMLCRVFQLLEFLCLVETIQLFLK